ncbi:hypothetical protein GGS23DRAFT_549617 [Durotheca rogersii]|uniref:uncharacterized protein n=1 Tax=Durotheca rogersii TaxID=419775 RepID=UPI00221FEB90|nr:uncharacterized protein GGS23DRAFT_549617 [Durotheca rogersii]KAI5867716.1 hypothetical protein GGS23DRAFT_549617 [Durotheca rogersii]
MGSRESDLQDRSREHRRSKNERDRDKDKDRERKGDRDGHHHHKSHSTRSKHKTASEVDALSPSHRRHRNKEEKDKEKELEKKSSSMNDLVPEFAKTSISGSRISLPYPTFSKAHSKEAVHISEDVDASARRPDPPTPEPTDLGAGRRRSKSVGGSANRKSSQKDDRPPSPPETDVSGDKVRRSKTSAARLREEHGSDRPRSRTSGISRSSSKHDNKSKLSRASSQATTIKSPNANPPPSIYTANDDASNLSGFKSVRASSTATPSAPKRSASSRTPRIPSPIEAQDSPESVQDSSPKTPTVTPQFPPSHVFPNEKAHQNAKYEEQPERPTPAAATPAPDYAPPPPPPPPPLSLDIHEVPRVDYLLQNGGLPHPVPRHFLAVIPRQSGMRGSSQPLAGPDAFFAPFFNLLDQYKLVLQKQGSVAVATGHKSVARRLLDRLEDVFSRDLPVEGCACVMCEKTPEEHRGLGWGEVLERVGGRVEMPPWPPFDMASVGANAIETVADMPPRPRSPVKLDPDIAEEFRDHYLRQSKKVRSAVDKWMTNCAEAPAPAPSEIDDETLTFAILTNLNQEERPYYNALLSGSKELQPALRAPTPLRKPRTDFMVKTGLALQRLYRLSQAPRDSETAVFLVKNPFHHDLLATITDINPQEWEILISGRFDGFLWSGADADDTITPTPENPLSRGATPANGFSSPPPSRGPGAGMRYTPGFSVSRSTTPFSGVYSRGATPASFVSLSSSVAPGYNRQPVSHDEEAEMAVLAEVEREIYQGMEALEDAFERLHEHAESVRNSLRQRNNGLLLSKQHRRAGKIDVLPQLSGNSQGSERPPWAISEDDGVASESDWGGDDFDLAPEDSASNISSSRHRRPKRRNERRTPAPIEEDDEEN